MPCQGKPISDAGGLGFWDPMQDNSNRPVQLCSSLWGPMEDVEPAIYLTSPSVHPYTLPFPSTADVPVRALSTHLHTTPCLRVWLLRNQWQQWGHIEMPVYQQRSCFVKALIIHFFDKQPPKWGCLENLLSGLWLIEADFSLLCDLWILVEQFIMNT